MGPVGLCRTVRRTDAPAEPHGRGCFACEAVLRKRPNAQRLGRLPEGAYGVSRKAPHPSRINQGAANGALEAPYSASIAASFSRAGPASFGLSSAKRIVASTRPRCVPQSKRVPSKR